MPILKKKVYRSTPNKMRGHFYQKDPNAKEINLNRIVKPVYDNDPLYKEGDNFISNRVLVIADLVNTFSELRETEKYKLNIKRLKDIKSEKGTIYYTFDDEKWLTEKEVNSNYLPAFTMDKVWPVYLKVNKQIKKIKEDEELKIFMAEKQQKIDNRKEAQKKVQERKTEEAEKIIIDQETFEDKIDTEKLGELSKEISAADKFSSTFDQPKKTDKVKKEVPKKTAKKKTTKKSTKSKTTTPKKTK